eukprot:2159163-Lingulodinium_polyedra.AAC.1
MRPWSEDCRGALGLAVQPAPCSGTPVMIPQSTPSEVPFPLAISLGSPRDRGACSGCNSSSWQQDTWQ